MLVPAPQLPVDLYQVVKGYCGIASLCLLVLLAYGLPAVAEGAGAVADAVNERIPVRGAELEAHWGVDCAMTWAALRTQAELADAGEQCAVAPQLRRSLELCVYIYQRPGDPVVEACPDYRAALGVLDKALPGDQCQPLLHFLSRKGRCPLPAPTAD
jgi:hypothetical protein